MLKRIGAFIKKHCFTILNIVIVFIAGLVIFKGTIGKPETPVQEETTSRITDLHFCVTSKSTNKKYVVFKYRIAKNNEMELQIYNYYSKEYEWYPIYQFYNTVEIARYIDVDYADEYLLDIYENVDLATPHGTYND